jgi:hypothetical protein
MHQCTGASASAQPCNAAWALANAVGSTGRTVSADRLHTRKKKHDRQALNGSTASASLYGCCSQSLTFQKTPAFLLHHGLRSCCPMGSVQTHLPQ